MRYLFNCFRNSVIGSHQQLILVNSLKNNKGSLIIPKGNDKSINFRPFPQPIHDPFLDDFARFQILLVGSKDFTLFGRPILPRDLVKVEATVVGKFISTPRVHFRFYKRPTRGTTRCKEYICS